MFLVFAGLQFNDPDPWVWIPIYGVFAILCFWDAFGIVPRILSLGCLISALVSAFLWWPDTFSGITGPMTPDSGVEEARESLGLAICAAACLWILFSKKNVIEHD